MPGLLTRLVSATSIFVFALTGTSLAATEIGQMDSNPGSSCVGSSYWMSASTVTPSYEIPAGGGVITSWSTRANGTSGREYGIRIFRSEGGSSYRTIGSGGVEILTPSTVNTFQVRIPVREGDRLGVYVGNVTGRLGPDGGASCIFYGEGGTVARVGVTSPEPAVGQANNFPFSYGNALPNVAATLEADADGDGYGDETQDLCPTDNSTQDVCPQPQPAEEPRQPDPQPEQTRQPDLPTPAATPTDGGGATVPVSVPQTSTVPAAPIARLAVTLSLNGKSAAARKTLQLTLRANRPASATVGGILRLGSRTVCSLPAKIVSLSADKSATLNVPLCKPANAIAKRRKRISATINVSAKTLDGQESQISRTIVVS